MDHPPVVNVVIVANDRAAAGRWAAALEGAACHVRYCPPPLPSPCQADLVLTDLAAGEDAGTLPAGRGAGTRWADEVGLIRMGASGPADVCLPADASGRELRLACRLLAEIVRLRRKDLARSRLQQQLAAEAMTDPLTGLPNRRAWDQVLADRLCGQREPGRRVCLVIVDLDHFKHVNDEHGHAAGDRMLRETGRGLVAGLRQHDFVARLGGDEFGLLLSVPDASTAAAVIERVRRGLPGRFARAGLPAATASAGFAMAHCSDPASPSPPAESLFLAADAALRQAKLAGRDRSVASASG